MFNNLFMKMIKKPSFLSKQATSLISEYILEESKEQGELIYLFIIEDQGKITLQTQKKDEKNNSLIDVKEKIQMEDFINEMLNKYPDIKNIMKSFSLDGSAIPMFENDIIKRFLSEGNKISLAVNPNTRKLIIKHISAKFEILNNNMRIEELWTPKE